MDQLLQMDTPAEHERGIAGCADSDRQTQEHRNRLKAYLTSFALLEQMTVYRCKQAHSQNISYVN